MQKRQSLHRPCACSCSINTGTRQLFLRRPDLLTLVHAVAVIVGRCSSCGPNQPTSGKQDTPLHVECRAMRNCLGRVVNERSAGKHNADLLPAWGRNECRYGVLGTRRWVVPHRAYVVGLFDIPHLRYGKIGIAAVAAAARYHSGGRSPPRSRT